MLKTDAMPRVLMDPRRHPTFLSVNHPKRRLFNELFIFGEVSKTLAAPGSSSRMNVKEISKKLFQHTQRHTSVANCVFLHHNALIEGIARCSVCVNFK